MNPLLGVFFHWLGGLSSASFYVPYKRIRRWSWEIFWIVGGLFSWVFAPWLIASVQTRHLIDVLLSVPPRTLFWCWLWGAMWGFGGLTFGLTMRYLGLSLGMAVALGLTTVIGTLGPPVFRGTLGELAAMVSGRVTFLGIAITLSGIVVVALAGRAKERELGAAANAVGVTEFNLRKGLLIAVFSGIMSGCFAWGLDAGQAIRDATVAAGTRPLWQGLPVLCVVLAGGLTTNLIWCALLIGRNGSLGELVGRESGGGVSGGGASGGGVSGGGVSGGGASGGGVSGGGVSGGGVSGGGVSGGGVSGGGVSGGRPGQAAGGLAPGDRSTGPARPPLLANYLFAALGGTLWYFQFFFYTMGESQMGRYGFSSWTLHMASIILFSTVWGFALQEWKGASLRTRWQVCAGIAVLVLSTIVIGIGNYYATRSAS